MNKKKQIIDDDDHHDEITTAALKPQPQQRRTLEATPQPINSQPVGQPHNQTTSKGIKRICEAASQHMDDSKAPALLPS